MQRFEAAVAAEPMDAVQMMHSVAYPLGNPFPASAWACLSLFVNFGISHSWGHQFRPTDLPGTCCSVSNTTAGRMEVLLNHDACDVRATLIT